MQLSKYINPLYKPMLPVKFQIDIQRDPAAYTKKWSAKITPVHPEGSVPSSNQQRDLEWRAQMRPSASFRWTLQMYVYMECRKYQRLWTKMNEDKNAKTFYYEP